MATNTPDAAWPRVVMRLSLVVVLLLAALGATFVPRILWLWREQADIGRLMEEARRLGGSASIPEGGLDYGERKIDLIVELTGDGVGDDDFTRLATMPAFKHTHILSLANTRITDASLHQIERGPPVILLDISGTKVTDGGLKSIAKLTYLTNLYLSGTMVTDAGLDSLMENSDRLRLGSIDLTNTRVTGEGVRRLTNAFDSLVIKHPSAVHPSSNQQR